MIPKFLDSHPDTGAKMQCPHCKETYLHHDKVEIFERLEDQDNGIHAIVEGGILSIDSNLEENPSARRHGLIINFWCECCKGKSTLTISQHKGNTLVNFLKRP